MKLTVFFTNRIYSPTNTFSLSFYLNFFSILCVSFFLILSCAKKMIWMRAFGTPELAKCYFFWTYFLVGRVKIHSEFCAQVSFFFFKIKVLIFRVLCPLRSSGTKNVNWMVLVDNVRLYMCRERPEIVQQNSSFSYVYVFQYAQFSSYTLCFFFSFYYYCYDYNNYCYFNFMLLVAFVKKTMIKSRRKITTPCMKSLCVHMWGEHSEHTWIYIYIHKIYT